MTGNRRSGQVAALLLIAYVCSRILELFEGKVPSLLIVILNVGSSALFAWIHLNRTYRWRIALVFTMLCLGTAVFFESLGLRTGFPFGRYVFTQIMGPHILQLPVFLAPAYLGMGYFSWILATVILRHPGKTRPRSGIVLVPLLASCVMVAWDLSMDPVWANIDGAWRWRDGGPYFGVPLTNFLGWFLTVFTFYLLFALYLRDQPAPTAPRSHWRFPILFYAASAAGNLLLPLSPHLPATVLDPAGHPWAVSSILWASAIVSIFAMGAFALLAWRSLPRPSLA